MQDQDRSGQEFLNLYRRLSPDKRAKVIEILETLARVDLMTRVQREQMAILRN